MTLWSELAPFAVLGLAGAGHCAGMCGGFAVAVGYGAGPARRRALGHGLAYVGGKALTYSVLGLCVARAGELLARAGGVALRPSDPAALGTLRAALAVAVGAGLVLAGLAALGARGPRRWFGRGVAARLATRLRPLFAAVRGLPGAAGALGTGLVTGLLPCGLSWSALALCLASDPAVAALGLALFGLATAPVLLFVGLGAREVPVRWRARAPWLVGPLLVALGLFTALRGWAPEPLAPALPECCTVPE